jgi:hypothetical protein
VKILVDGAGVELLEELKVLLGFLQLNWWSSFTSAPQFLGFPAVDAWRTYPFFTSLVRNSWLPA